MNSLPAWQILKGFQKPDFASFSTVFGTLKEWIRPSALQKRSLPVSPGYNTVCGLSVSVLPAGEWLFL